MPACSAISVPAHCLLSQPSAATTHRAPCFSSSPTAHTASSHLESLKARPPVLHQPRTAGRQQNHGQAAHESRLLPPNTCPPECALPSVPCPSSRCVWSCHRTNAKGQCLGDRPMKRERRQQNLAMLMNQFIVCIHTGYMRLFTLIMVFCYLLGTRGGVHPLTYFVLM